jgi:hypothetical protein
MKAPTRKEKKPNAHVQYTRVVLRTDLRSLPRQYVTSAAIVEGLYREALQALLGSKGYGR